MHDNTDPVTVEVWKWSEITKYEKLINDLYRILVNNYQNNVNLMAESWQDILNNKATIYVDVFKINDKIIGFNVIQNIIGQKNMIDSSIINKNIIAPAKIIEYTTFVKASRAIRVDKIDVKRF